MKHKVFRVIVYIFILIFLSACNNKSNDKVNSGDNSPNVVKRTDTYTLNSEKRDLDTLIGSDIKKISTEKPNKYHLSATVTFQKAEDANRIIYEIIMDEYKEEMTNVIQSFTLEPRMLKYFHTTDLTTTNVHNSNETNLAPNQEPFGLSVYRGYVINNETMNKKIIDIYKNVYVKISYGRKEARVENYWLIQAKPSKELLKYLETL